MEGRGWLTNIAWIYRPETSTNRLSRAEAEGLAGQIMRF
jgi:hypothetical protein